MTLLGRWIVARPRPLNWVAGEYGNEDVDDVEDANHRHQDPEGNALPALVRTDSEQEKSHYQLHEPSYGDVEERGNPPPHDGLGAVQGSHVVDMLADAVVDTEKGAGSVNAIQHLCGSQQECQQVDKKPWPLAFDVCLGALSFKRRIKSYQRHQGKPVLDVEPFENDTHGVEAEGGGDERQDQEDYEHGRQGRSTVVCHSGLMVPILVWRGRSRGTKSLHNTVKRLCAVGK